jgi:beta-N-acetylhexosaminidase
MTRRRFLAGAFYGTLATLLAACGAPASPSPSASGAPSASPSPASSAPTQSIAPSASTPASPSPSPSGSDAAALRRKIASLLVVGFRGQQVAPTDWIARAIAGGLGGVILFDRDQLTGARRNIASPAQVRALIRSLQASAPRPLIVSIDQEGGQVARLNPGDGFPKTQSEAAIGAADDPAAARTWARGMADDLASIGVTLNFAPVVDLDVNPTNPAIGALDRSFSANAGVVVAMASQEIAAHHAAGIRTSLKHFPGFGSATGNTDFGVVDVTATWRPAELQPFRQLIAAGIVDTVMVAHLLNRQLDKTLPASLSPAVVTDLLRGQLGWTGVVVSDDMQAAAITRRYGRAEAVRLALQAGVDQLVFANQQVYDAGVVDEVVDGIVELIGTGKISEARIDESVARVDALRVRPH